MNFTNLYINNTNFIYLPPYLNTYKSCAFFHMEATGHYWRNSSLLKVSLLYQETESDWIKKEWFSEKESDEYDILELFLKEISPFTSLIGFNCSSFHVPYLEQKYKAYGLPSPFKGKVLFDQLKAVKSIGKRLHISTRLNDLRIFLRLNEELSDIECIAATTAIYDFETILSGAFLVEKAELHTGEMLIYCKTAVPFPSDIRIHTDEFYLIGSDHELKLKIKVYENRLKLYYSNYKDYFYLPEEDSVIHKSLAASIHKDKKVKATAQNCFSYISITEGFCSNSSNVTKYVTALLQHYMNT